MSAARIWNLIRRGVRRSRGFANLRESVAQRHCQRNAEAGISAAFGFGVKLPSLAKSQIPKEMPFCFIQSYIVAFRRTLVAVSKHLR
jgi:hypothetical protein